MASLPDVIAERPIERGLEWPVNGDRTAGGHGVESATRTSGVLSCVGCVRAVPIPLAATSLVGALCVAGAAHAAGDAPPAAEPQGASTVPGVTLSARGGVDVWMAGRVAGQPIGDVFRGAPTSQLDAGLAVTRRLSIYAGWQHAFYGVGGASPYALYPHANARGDLYMLGARFTCDGVIGILFGGDLGYLDLHSDASDGAGGSAAVDLPAIAARAGLGLCLRPVSRLLLSWNVQGMAAWPTGSYGGSVTSGGVTRAAGGHVDGGSPYLAVSPGVSVTWELPF